MVITKDVLPEVFQLLPEGCPDLRPYLKEEYKRNECRFTGKFDPPEPLGQ